ncbi:THO complex subunit 4D [Capsicum annuum]|uniref:THO complex subunit 4D n=1 Tax=Capsicum annuum TaxID=4072 RepID=UPI0007BF0E0A|nr:THO complex subunit 4D [Capsicum annuum]XP_047268373.1 THO complex subunit 4D [Capsicum annuum]
MASLDMTLEDMIKSRRNSEKGGRGQGRARRGRGQGGSFRGGRTTGAPRRGALGVNARPSANRIAKNFRRTKNMPWQNGLLEDSLRAAGVLSSGLESGTKVYVSNLEVGVTNSDIRELFSEIGELIRYAIHYDKNGRPSGSAEVVFARRSDAYQALKRYNNVQLDGKPMKIEIIAPKPDIPLSARVDVGRVNGRRTVVMPGSARGRGGASAANRGSSQRGNGGLGNASGRGRGRGRGRGGRGRGGRGRKNGVEKSAAELDKELENYHASAEAMET